MIHWWWLIPAFILGAIIGTYIFIQSFIKVGDHIKEVIEKAEGPK